MTDITQRILDAADQIDRDGVPNDMAPLVARWVEKVHALRVNDDFEQPHVPLDADEIRRAGHVTPDAASIVAETIRALRKMPIGPDAHGNWPANWLAVDMASLDIANAVRDREHTTV